MSDRILIWNNVGLIQFSLAKFLQDIHDCELFAFHDLNHHLKKSFLEQKIVNFKNEWYYWGTFCNTFNFCSFFSHNNIYIKIFSLF